MRLQELFKQTDTPWRWTFRGSEEADATFTVGDVQYTFYAYTDIKNKGVWEVEFRAVEGVDPDKRYGLTGTGNSAQVMSTVVTILAAFLTEYKGKISVLIFTAKEHSRRDLYAKMVQRLLPQWEFSLDRDKFTLTAPRDQSANLNETADEDRALISLGASVYDTIIKYDGKLSEEVISVGTIGELYDTPVTVLDNVKIELQSGVNFAVYAEDDPKATKTNKHAVWNADDFSIRFNLELLDTQRMRTTPTHELRHALDEVKSDSYKGGGNKYFTPKKKEHRKVYHDANGEVDKTDARNMIPYLAQPGEINARFTEVLDQLVTLIPKRFNNPHVSADNIKRQLSHDLKNIFVKYNIAELFPEKTQSPDYKRLYKRAYEFMNKEIQHVEKTSSQHATGGW